MTLRNCDGCGRSYEAKRATSKFCSSDCRVRAHRQPKSAPSATVVLPAQPTPPTSAVAAATRAALDEAGRSETALGAATLALAARIDDGSREPGSAFAALVREHRAALAEALRGANQVANPLDELRARRDQKRAG